MEQKMDFFLKINPLLSNKFEFAVVDEGLVILETRKKN
jgi:hypothetical protein